MSKSTTSTPLMALSRSQLQTFRRKLLSFYDEHRRELPWRETSDPYAILVSEIMLQQTQVVTVIPRWKQFLALFPTVEALANVSEEKVCEAWAGLGYYRRARNLHKAATQIMSLHNGQFPTGFTDILALAGVGRYTAGAVASIAFGQEVPVVDGNVVRVLARYFGVALPKDNADLHKSAWQLMTELAPGQRPGDFNQAVMELGATVCTPAQPSCADCPIRSKCVAKLEGRQTSIPMPKVPKAREILHVAFGIFRDEAGFAVLQRPLDGLWAGLWEPLSAQGAESDEAKRNLIDAHFQNAEAIYFCDVKHVLTHREVNARVYEVKGTLKENAKIQFAIEPKDLGLSKLAVKVFDAWSQPTQRDLFS